MSKLPNRCIHCGENIVYQKKTIIKPDIAYPEIFVIDKEVSVCPKCGDYLIRFKDLEKLEKFRVLFLIKHYAPEMPKREFIYIRQILMVSSGAWEEALKLQKKK